VLTDGHERAELLIFMKLYLSFFVNCEKIFLKRKIENFANLEHPKNCHEQKAMEGGSNTNCLC